MSIARLPELQVWLTANAIRHQVDCDLASSTTLRIGGRAALLIEWPQADAAGQELLARLAEWNIDCRILGGGSNLLIDDSGGLVSNHGVIIQLKTEAAPKFDDDGVTAPAGFALPRLAHLAAGEGLAGLEAFAGVPGTVGGAVAMNAGCWGTEIKDIFAWAETVGPEGSRRLGASEAGFSYRHSNFQAGGAVDRTVCTSLIRRARFVLRREHPRQVRERLLNWQRQRETTQPIHTRTAGSTWTNPEGHRVWKLLDDCGLRGYAVGALRLSEKHCNFLVNAGGGSYADALAVLTEAERRVQEKFGITLQREIQLWPALQARPEEQVRA